MVIICHEVLFIGIGYVEQAARCVGKRYFDRAMVYVCCGCGYCRLSD